MQCASEDWDRVVGMVARDPLAVDATVSLFAAGVQSYRWDSILKPFPPCFMTAEKEKDIERLRRAFAMIPPLSQLRQATASFSQHADNQDVVQLLSWLFQAQHPYLRSCPRDMFQSLDTAIGQVPHSIPADYVIEVCRTSEQATPGTKLLDQSEGNDDEVVVSRARDSHFAQQCQRFGHFMAYHGSRTENFHSILHSGLIAHLNKTALFGYGTYLSTALPVAMTYSPNGKAWQHSVIGRDMACVAVCDVVDHPSHVKRSVDDPSKSQQARAAQPDAALSASSTITSSSSTSSATVAATVASSTLRSRHRQAVTDDGTGDIPEKYVVVSNNDLIQVRYLLMYGQHGSPVQRVEKQAGWLQRLWRENQFACVMVFYTLVLVIVGLARSHVLADLFREALM